MVLKYREENPKFFHYGTIFFFIVLVLLDRLTKVWATALTTTKDYGFFTLHYVTNTGAGFSILQNQNTALIIIAIVVLAVLIYLRSEFPTIGLVLIVSGLVGNLLDRIFFGFVIDFIDLQFWPVFNGADSMICIGAIISIIYMFRHNKDVPAIEKKIRKKKSQKRKK